MGTRKGLLPLKGSTIIGSTMEVLGTLFRRVFVVARESSPWEGLGVEVLLDGRREQGPLVGLARGLAATDAPWCFVVGCDMPFLKAQVIRRMAEYLDGPQAVAADLEGRVQPLHAFYSRDCLGQAGRLLDEGKTSLHALLSTCRVRTMSSGDFLDIDPHLLSFTDVDTLEEYHRVQRHLGEEASIWTIPP